MKAYVLPESTPGKLQHLTIFIVSILCGLAVWAWTSGSLFPSILFPGPQATLREGVRMLESGSIIVDAAVSLARIVAGFTIGSAIGIVVGLLIGYFPMVRTAFNPYLQFFRFVPPIAWVSPAMIWFGVGETSKIFIIVYGTVFTVALSAVAGVADAHVNKIRAAQMFGATRWQIFRHVVIPSTVSPILTGMRVSMGISFMTVIAAEMLAAESGIGYLILNSRLWMATDKIFVGIFVLGCLGYGADRIFDLIIGRWACKYHPNPSR
ncbi:ABC transporter permease [Bordetella pertussis]|uniref:ABC transporter permease n=1 Tax=Bordetella pertussis TaxID=520 RepID=UPI0028E97AAD|nr:ABC transporter permease [Bordetella pertussis]WNQ74600.1 ABC transporter permease [Bordetella pertussis]